jgi:non-lysosomal glucosylceramidase
MQWADPKRVERNTKVYTSRHTALRALLGGIGAGNISLDACGRLCDFEFFGRPDKGVKYPYNFFAIWARPAGGAADARLLEAVPHGVSTRALGVPSGDLGGLPRFLESRYRCQYPFSHIDFIQPDYPLEVAAEAFTPFEPLNAANSSLPGFCITYTARNLTDVPVDVAVSGSLYNLYGFLHYDGIDYVAQAGTPENRYVERDGLKALELTGSGLGEDAVNWGNICLATPETAGVTAKPHWRFGSWWDGAEEFWQDFSQEGTLNPDVDAKAIGSKLHSGHKKHIGSLAVRKTIPAGGSESFTFYVGWYFPNRYGWWPRGHAPGEDLTGKPLFRNWYAKKWASALDALCWLNGRYDGLKSKSRDFALALYGSALPADVIESLVSAITVIRSPTCFRLDDDTFWGWEGCFDHAGSCEGNCTHVWNYAQALAFLFPELEQSMRRTEFVEEIGPDGALPFRAHKHLKEAAFDMLPAADGQLGSVLRVYREWKLGAGDAFLKEMWPGLRSALAFSLDNWDRDGDGVMEYQQHNTYDIEFYGPSSLTNGILYAALHAGAAMARAMGDEEQAALWQQTAARGAARMDALLYNGRYYQQAIDAKDLDRYQYQYGKGCLADQQLGQQLAHLYGLGYVLPAAHVRSAVQQVFQNNYRERLDRHSSVQRGYAWQDEGGLVLCSWPNGGRPKQPFVYSDEVWTGIEYQVATHLIYEGMPHHAKTIVGAIRKRYDGYRRSPFDEIECGHHYARSMAAWGLLVALSGYRFDLPDKSISFAPADAPEGEFACFFSCAVAWGVYKEGCDGRGKWFEAIPLGGDLRGININGVSWRPGRIRR